MSYLEDKRKAEIAMDEKAETIAADLAKAVDAWLKPWLEKLVGKKAVEGVGIQDFESVLAVNQKMLFLKKTQTQKGNGATFHFRLCQGIPQKHICLAKLDYKIDDLRPSLN